MTVNTAAAAGTIVTAAVTAAAAAVKDTAAAVAAAAEGAVVVVVVIVPESNIAPAVAVDVAGSNAAVDVAVADDPCRHACHGLHYPCSYHCCLLHAPRFTLPNRSESRIQRPGHGRPSYLVAYGDPPH